MAETDFAYQPATDTPGRRGRGCGRPLPPLPNAYEVASGWTRSDPRWRPRLSRQAASQYKSISLLPRAWGERLDALGARLRELRWLAGTTGHGFSAAREARYLALVNLLEHPDPSVGRGVAFEALVDSMPKMRQQKRTT